MMAKRKAPKRKAPKRKPREIVLVELDAFEEYGNSHPGNFAPMIWSEIGDDDHSPLWGLVDALHAIDQHGVTNPRPDKKPLIDLLKSTGTMWNRLLADLINRYDLKKPNYPTPRPIYSMSDENQALWQACYAVRDLVREGRDGKMSVADAITQVAEERNIRRKKLADAYQGRARAMRKKK
jgi:hypothetical protein